MITIYGELYSKKNSKMIVGKTRKFLIPSAAYRVHEKAMAQQLRDNRQKFLDMIAGKEKPLELKHMIYRKTARKWDYTNLVQGLHDCMVSEGLLPDDNANEIIPVFMPYAIDRNNPRVELWV